MSAEERQKTIRLLKESEQQFLEAVEKLSDAQWNFKPTPESWSVGECAEHILLSEGAIFGNVERALKNAPNPAWQEQTGGKTEFLERVLPNRDRKAQAPEAIVPNRGLSRSEIMKRFKEARAKTLQFAENTDASLKDHTVEHPFPVFKTLNAYQWLIYVPLHNIRHNLQILEVKASTEFPK